MRQIPFAEFVPRLHECEIRLPPDLNSFLEN